MVYLLYNSLHKPISIRFRFRLKTVLSYQRGLFGSCFNKTIHNGSYEKFINIIKKYGYDTVRDPIHKGKLIEWTKSIVEILYQGKMVEIKCFSNLLKRFQCDDVSPIDSVRVCFTTPVAGLTTLIESGNVFIVD